MTALRAAKGAFTTDGRGLPNERQAVGFDARAAVLWWSRQQGEGIERGNRGGFGFWTPEAGVSIAWASDDDASPTRTANVAADAALIGLTDAGGEIAMRADIDSFGPGGPVVRWSTRPSERWIVHFLALGGECVVGTRVGWVASPSAPARERLDLDGIRSDLLLFASAGAESRSVPVSGLSLGLGAVSAPGQAAAGYVSRHGAPSGAVGGAQRTDAAVLLVRDQHELALLGSVASDDSGSPCIDWTNAGPDRHSVCYLAVEGPRCKVGTAISPRKLARYASAVFERQLSASSCG